MSETSSNNFTAPSDADVLSQYVLAAYGFPVNRQVFFKLLSTVLTKHPDWNVSNMRFEFQVEHVPVLPKSDPFETSDTGHYVGHTLTQTSIDGGGKHYRARLYWPCLLAKDFCLANTTGIIVEYNMPNILALHEAQAVPPYVLNSIIYIPPLVYDLYAHRSGRDPWKPVVTFMKYSLQIRPRRRKMLNRLKRLNIDVESFMNFAEGGPDTVLRDKLRQTAILLNVHQSNAHHAPEEFRILPALLCGVVVISEPVPYVDSIPWAPYVVWATNEQFPRKVLEVQRNYAELWTSFFGRNSDLPGVLNRMWRNAVGQLENMLEKRLRNHSNGT